MNMIIVSFPIRLTVFLGLRRCLYSNYLPVEVVSIRLSLSQPNRIAQNIAVENRSHGPITEISKK